ncbi:hypothetical protein WICPIJ_009857 [Wickerhamomyces pijperi]|uniref:Maintenance of mitochondrial morphology protein 1 n=1 Tax=Wickerhamomyces pijperi TaxID=599730 RepID=A0A9P8PJB6_WICPI|nr:hypothetical protein WICPIJ_009857 [Wickerhamomyces pijperi]
MVSGEFTSLTPSNIPSTIKEKLIEYYIGAIAQQYHKYISLKQIHSPYHDEVQLAFIRLQVLAGALQLSIGAEFEKPRYISSPKKEFLLIMTHTNEHTTNSQSTDLPDPATTIVIQEDAQSTLITLDEYINKALPYHLQKQLHLQANSLHASAGSWWSFTQGLLLGQLSVIVVFIFFIKFFVFSENKTTTDKLKTELRKTSPVIKSKKSNIDNLTTSTDDHSDLQSSINSILEKTYYNVETHSSESLDWFNVLVAQTINQFRLEALMSDNIVHSLDDFLAKAELPDFLDQISITELDIGDDYPIFSNCRITKNPLNPQNLQAKIDVDLSDTLTLGIETNLLLNQPKPLTACLPVQLSVSIVRFSGCLTVSLISVNDEGITNEEDKSGKGTALMFSFAPDFRLEFSIRSLIGSRSKLENVPKIGSLIEHQLKSWFIERCVEPRSQVIRLPSMWPSRKNVREPVINEDNNTNANE